MDIGLARRIFKREGAREQTIVINIYLDRILQIFTSFQKEVYPERFVVPIDNEIRLTQMEFQLWLEIPLFTEGTFACFRNLLYKFYVSQLV